mmetsp:Transcript_15846/g.47908  ORF Transcript_15846/g.47908 Transcript_15846/m.47908 type:complete len:372 (+) Transcript_15846:563-1678(+)
MVTQAAPPFLCAALAGDTVSRRQRVLAVIAEEHRGSAGRGVAVSANEVQALVVASSALPRAQGVKGPLAPRGHAVRRVCKPGLSRARLSPPDSPDTPGTAVELPAPLRAIEAWGAADLKDGSYSKGSGGGGVLGAAAHVEHVPHARVVRKGQALLLATGFVAVSQASPDSGGVGYAGGFVVAQHRRLDSRNRRAGRGLLSRLPVLPDPGTGLQGIAWALGPPADYTTCERCGPREEASAPAPVLGAEAACRPLRCPGRGTGADGKATALMATACHRGRGDTAVPHSRRCPGGSQGLGPGHGSERLLGRSRASRLSCARPHGGAEEASMQGECGKATMHRAVHVLQCCRRRAHMGVPWPSTAGTAWAVLCPP